MPFANVDIALGHAVGLDSLGPGYSETYNWEPDQSGVLRPRYGLASYSVTGYSSAATIGLERFQTSIVAVDNSRYFYVINDATPSIATVLSTATTSTQLEGYKRPTFASGENYVFAAGGGRVSYWAPGMTAAAMLTASPHCTHVAAIGQRLVTNNVDDTAVFNFSDIGESTWGTWPDENFANADSRPDPIYGVYENLGELYVFGQQTLQVYGISSDPVFPFDSVSTINIGVSGPYSVVKLDQSFMLFDERRRFVLTDGRSFQVASDPIASTLRGLTTVSDCFGYREATGQLDRIVWRFPTERRTFVYDLPANKWISERRYYSSDNADWPVNAYVYRHSDAAHIVGLATGGLAQMSTTHLDVAQPLVCELTTRWHDHGTSNSKRSTRVRVTMRRGTAAENATPGALEVRIQNENGPWTPWRQISVGNPAQYEQVRDIYFGGVFRRRRYNVRFSNTEEMSLVSVMDDVTELAS